MNTYQIVLIIGAASAVRAAFRYPYLFIYLDNRDERRQHRKTLKAEAGLHRQFHRDDGQLSSSDPTLRVVQLRSVTRFRALRPLHALDEHSTTHREGGGQKFVPGSGGALFHEPSTEPLANYNKLTAKQVLLGLSGADHELLQRIFAYEEGHKKRTTLLKALKRRLDAA